MEVSLKKLLGGVSIGVLFSYIYLAQDIHTILSSDWMNWILESSIVQQFKAWIWSGLPAALAAVLGYFSIELIKSTGRGLSSAISERVPTWFLGTIWTCLVGALVYVLQLQGYLSLPHFF